MPTFPLPGRVHFLIGARPGFRLQKSFHDWRDFLKEVFRPKPTSRAGPLCITMRLAFFRIESQQLLPR